MADVDELVKRLQSMAKDFEGQPVSALLLEAATCIAELDAQAEAYYFDMMEDR